MWLWLLAKVLAIVAPAAYPRGMARRGWGDDGIYWAASRSRFVGAISLGFAPDGKRVRKVVTGKTKQEVKDKLKSLHDELSRSVRSSRRYTIARAVDDS